MKKILILFSILGFLLLISSCCEKTTSPSNDTHHIGWIVGDPDDGYGTILKTSNSGQTWERQGSALTIPDLPINSIRAYDSLTVWAAGPPSGGWATILKTTDGGEDWQRIGNRGDLPDKEILCVHVINHDEVWAVGYGNTVLYTDNGGTGVQPEGGVILYSSNYGEAWEVQSNGDFLKTRELIEISAGSDSSLWVVGHGRTILHTSNGGNEWIIQKADIEAAWDANGVTAISENEAWVAEDLGYIYHTTDGGLIWDHQTNRPDSANSYFLYRTSPINSKVAWVVGPCATPPFDGIILFTVDSGITWTRQHYQPDVAIWDVSFVGSYH